MHGMRHASLSNAFSPVLRLLLSLLVAFPASGLRTISGDEAPGERPEGAVWGEMSKAGLSSFNHVFVMFNQIQY